MLKVYGNLSCPDCMRLKESFDKHGISYEYYDVLSDLGTFKGFLRLRDKEKAFDEVKEFGKIGIPALVFPDGFVRLDWEDYVKEQGLSAGAAAKTSCSLNGKGC